MLQGGKVGVRVVRAAPIDAISRPLVKQALEAQLLEAPLEAPVAASTAATRRISPETAQNLSCQEKSGRAGSAASRAMLEPIAGAPAAR